MAKDAKKPIKANQLENQLYMIYLLTHVLMDILVEKGLTSKEEIETRLDKKNKEWQELERENKDE